MWIVRLALRWPYTFTVMRVYVFVPQTNAASMREGLNSKIIVQERPGQDFEGTVTRTAGALDPTSRTMQVEVQVPNHDGTLYAGIYGQFKFLLPTTMRRSSSRQTHLFFAHKVRKLSRSRGKTAFSGKTFVSGATSARNWKCSTDYLRTRKSS